MWTAPNTSSCKLEKDTKSIFKHKKVNESTVTSSSEFLGYYHEMLYFFHCIYWTMDMVDVQSLKSPETTYLLEPLLIVQLYGGLGGKESNEGLKSKGDEEREGYFARPKERQGKCEQE